MLKVRNGVLDGFKYLLPLLLIMVVIVMIMNMILTIPTVMLMFSRSAISSTACLITSMIMSEYDDYSHG